MKTLDISTRLLSEMVWKRLLESAAHRLLEKFGFADHSTVALLIPQTALRLTPQ